MDGAVVHSVAGAVYDLLGYVHPALAVPHDGLKFTTWTMDQDTIGVLNCGLISGGGWWFNRCALFAPTVMNPNPEWLSLPDANWYPMKNIHLMVKLQ